MNEMRSRHATMESARVPHELQDLWAAKQDVIISNGGAKIDFFGAANLWWQSKHLTLKQLKLVTDAFILSLLHDKVTSINVSLCSNLTDASIKAIARVCPELRKLNVSHCSNLTDESIKAIAKGRRQLTELNVSGIKDLTDDSIKAIAQHCPKLKKLNMLDSSNLTHESIKAIAYCYPELLNDFNVSYSSKLTDQSIKAIADGCPELKELNVLNCSNFTDESIAAIAEGCSELEKLNVYGITNLTDDSIKAIANGCPELKELNVSGISNLTDQSIKAIAKECPKLKELNVSHCYNITDEAIKAIAEGCTELTELNVYGITNLTDASMKATAKGCPELNELNVLDYYSNLTDESIKVIAESCPRLKQLNVIGSSNLTDESIKAIATHCPELRELNVSRCKNLTDESIKAIANKCPDLNELNVSGTSNTDESIKAIAKGCPKLRLLDVCSSDLISLPEDIGDRLPELHWIAIAFCKITTLPSSIAKLKNLQFLYVRDNPLQSPPYEIARQGPDAIKRYFDELEKGSVVSKLLKVVLVGDGEAGKTSLRNALAGRPNPRQNDRTIHLDIERIALTADLDINVYDCGGQEEYLATQLPYLTGLALYMVVVEAQYAADEYAYALEDKLHRFLVVLQNRVPGAVVLPIVTKTDTVEDSKRRCDWLESRIKKWLQDTRQAVCCDLLDSASGHLRPALRASDAHTGDGRTADNGFKHNFNPLCLQLPALAVSVADADDEKIVQDSVMAVRNRIIALTKRDPPLLRGVGQKIPVTYVAVLKLFGAIAEHGDNGRALEALRDDTAQALGETSALSPTGTYRAKDELEKIWNTYRDEPDGNEHSKIFDDATQLWEDQGLILVDTGLIVLQPEFLTTIVKPLVDHRYSDEEQYEQIKDDVVQFLKSTPSRGNYSYNQLVKALNTFRASGEVDCSDDSLFLSFLWRDTALDRSHYRQVLRMLTTSGVILKVERDAGERRTVVVVPFRLPQNPDETKMEAFWPKKLPSKERELKLRFEPRLAFPTGLAERFVTDVHGLGKSLYCWRSGAVVKDCAKYSAFAMGTNNVLHFTVRFEAYSSEKADAAWKALCDAQKILAAHRDNRFPGLFYEEYFLCEECCCNRQREVATEIFNAESRTCVFDCGHCFELPPKGKCDDASVGYHFHGRVSKSRFIGVADGEVITNLKRGKSRRASRQKKQNASNSQVRNSKPNSHESDSPSL